MSSRRLAGGLGPVHILVLVAVLEVAINRVAVPMLRPADGAPPTWHTYLDYVGLFLFYFTGTLAVCAIAMFVARGLARPHGVRDVLARLALALAAGLAAIPLVIAPPAVLSIPLEIAFGLAVCVIVIAGFGRGRDVGAQLGLVAFAVPLLVHTVAVLGATYLWPEPAFASPGNEATRGGVLALCLAALVSPYVFAPRPFAKAVTRPLPVLIAMAIAAAGAILARMYYLKVARGAGLAIGIELDQMQADPRLALYLLAVATLAWTLSSCAFAASPARRHIGLGVALVVLGGYGFRWPSHYLLPLLGLALVGDALRRVRDEELAAEPFTSATPEIADATWSAYIGSVKAGLERSLDDVHTLTTRGEDGAASSVIVGSARGLAVRTRIERIAGSVVALDIILGREIEEVRGATFTLWAIPPRGAGTNPAAPPAAPLFKTGDSMFDDRFKTRGNRIVFDRVFDEGLRARVAATLDGWLAYWEPHGLRYRVYPGRGAPLDHPMPLSDLALGRGVNADRLVAIVELLVEVAARGIVREPAAEPTTLDDADVEPT